MPGCRPCSGPSGSTGWPIDTGGHANLLAADGLLNLPAEQHSHGVKRLAVVEATRGSFGEAGRAISRRTGTAIGRRQVESLSARAAADVEDFYTARRPPVAQHTDLLVISAEGHGIVMRPDSLRPQTAAKAAAASSKLKTRLPKGEKRNRKRLAEVGAVYDHPTPRTAAEVMEPRDQAEQSGATVPRPKHKWVTASVVDDAAQVLTGVFDEAERRDPDHRRTWVALVDGDHHQIDRVKAESAALRVEVAIVIDFIHVLEYLWAAGWCFFTEADPAAKEWGRNRANAVLAGRATAVAAGLRRPASAQRLPPAKHKKADDADRYLNNKVATWTTPPPWLPDGRSPPA
jgi:hypothetical protein